MNLVTRRRPVVFMRCLVAGCIQTVQYWKQVSVAFFACCFMSTAEVDCCRISIKLRMPLSACGTAEIPTGTASVMMFYW